MYGTGDLHHTLHLLRSDVLAAGGLDQVLLPVSDPQIALFVKLANVPGREPAIFERLRGCLRHVVVAAHDARAFDQNLPIVGDLDLSTRHRRANGAETGGTRVVHAGRNAGLSKAVTLQHEEPGSVEPFLHLPTQRSGARHEEFDLATHPGFDLAEDQSIRQRVLDAKKPGRFLSRQPQRRYLAADAERPVEDLGLDSVRGSHHHSGSHFLEDPRRAAHEGRLNHGKVLNDLVDPAVNRSCEADVKLDRDQAPYRRHG